MLIVWFHKLLNAKIRRRCCKTQIAAGAPGLKEDHQANSRNIFVSHISRVEQCGRRTMILTLYSLLVPSCTTTFNIQHFPPFCPHSIFVCLSWISEKQLLFLYTALTNWFVGMFAKWWKAIITFVMSVCLYVCPLTRNNGLPINVFSQNFDI
jgi:hypothetical protein